MDLVATHQRCLVGAALRTIGPILELGVGWYSTPILHEIAEVQQRKLYTVDNNEYWIAQFKVLEEKSRWHFVWPIGWWGELREIAHEAMHFGLVFVDQGQPCEREYAIRMLLNQADVFVMHDTEEEFAYGYGRTLPLFKYLYTDRCQKAWTTVASNTIDVSQWFIDLPPVEPTSEVT